MKKIIGILLLVFVCAGCSTVKKVEQTLRENPLLTMAVVEQVLKDYPAIADEAAAISSKLLLLSEGVDTIGKLEQMAYIQIQRGNLTPAQKEIAYGVVRSIKGGLIQDMDRAGIIDTMQRHQKVLEFLTWLSGQG